MTQDEARQDCVATLRAWAASRIVECRRHEEKFMRAWQHREKREKGPPQSLVEAWQERRTLQAVIGILDDTPCALDIQR